MEEGFVEISQVPSRVITLGGWIDKPVVGGKLILVIPGNPGVIGYYEMFMQFLYQRTGEKIPVWGICHGGHEFPLEKSHSIPCVNRNPHLYTLKGQVQHKIDFIEKYIPENVAVYLIGHSIGAKICTELMKHFEKRNMFAYLLFPTLERMAESPNGRRIWPLLGPLRKPMVLAARMLNFLPRPWLTRLVHWGLSSGRRPALAITDSAAVSSPPSLAHGVKPTLHLLHPVALERSLFMADDELKVVRELDVQEIKMLGPRLRFYFGVGDKWCPEHHYHELVQAVPEVRAVLCPHGMEHAFVLQHSEPMARIVTEWLRED